MRTQLDEQVRLSSPAVQNKANRQIINVNRALKAMETGAYGFAYVVGAEFRWHG